MADLQQWTLGWGLGLMLHRRGERFFVGHDGAMPGFLASMVVHRDSGLAVVALTSTSRAADPFGLAVELAETVLDAAPELPKAWRPGPAVPADVEGLLGTWWTEGMEFEASWRAGSDPQVDGDEGGHLELRAAGAAASRPPAVLRRDGQDRWRVVSGREQGEALRVVRDGAGVPSRLYWATYPMTRQPLPFGA
jgi:hypothetical protein